MVHTLERARKNSDIRFTFSGPAHCGHGTAKTPLCPIVRSWAPMLDARSTASRTIMSFAIDLFASFAIGIIVWISIHLKMRISSAV